MTIIPDRERDASPLRSVKGLANAMNARLDYGRAAPGVYEAMDALDRYLQACGLERTLILLVQLRASQVNGCAYCLDMHWKDLRAVGETEQRLYSLDAWGECPYYSARERAALAWAEAVTAVANGHVPDVVYDEVRAVFDEKQLADLTLAVAAINAWNRLSIAARLRPGTYQPAALPRDLPDMSASTPNVPSVFREPRP